MVFEQLVAIPVLFPPARPFLPTPRCEGILRAPDRAISC
ncbi:hypothetical protein CSOJ01_05077 [Colletotrichum sojae]|uniref:Uncharacterized protein n=1 Tax=Colletotrichum sojae TaxID=2175907 RepID=A0A8H6JH58_9PEZI|nr:hypothetical protein CSOJ01_05077 [Colletotrichum sojae]